MLVILLCAMIQVITCQYYSASPYYSGGYSGGVYPASTYPLQQKFNYGQSLSAFPFNNVRSSYIPAFQAAPAYSSTPFRVRFIAAKISHYFLQFQNSKLSPLLSNYLTRAGPNTPGYGSGVIVV